MVFHVILRKSWLYYVLNLRNCKMSDLCRLSFLAGILACARPREPGAAGVAVFGAALYLMPGDVQKFDRDGAGRRLFA
jgi:hypothetical protein